MSCEGNICSMYLEHWSSVKQCQWTFSPAVCLTFPSLSHYLSFLVYCPPQALSQSPFLYFLLTVYTSKPVAVRQSNSSPLCISPTTISAVHCALPLVFHLLIIDNIRPKHLKHFCKTPVYKCWQVLCSCLYNLPYFAPIWMNTLDIPPEAVRLCYSRYLRSNPWLINLNKSCIVIMNIYFHNFLIPLVLVNTLLKYANL
jgi:hypothetical protein